MQKRSNINRTENTVERHAKLNTGCMHRVAIIAKKILSHADVAKYAAFQPTVTTFFFARQPSIKIDGHLPKVLKGTCGQHANGNSHCSLFFFLLFIPASMAYLLKRAGLINRAFALLKNLEIFGGRIEVIGPSFTATIFLVIIFRFFISQIVMVRQTSYVAWCRFTATTYHIPAALIPKFAVSSISGVWTRDLNQARHPSAVLGRSHQFPSLMPTLIRRHVCCWTNTGRKQVSEVNILLVQLGDDFCHNTALNFDQQFINY